MINKISYANQVIDFLDEKIASGIDDLGISYEAPLSKEDYALIIKTASDELKKFPINNKENAIFSYVSYEKNAHKLNDSMKKIAGTYISKALDLFGVENNLEKHEINSNTYSIKYTDEMLPKQADFPQLFAYDEKLPIDTVENLHKSSREFLKQARALPLKTRKEIAYTLVKRAEELSVNIPVGVFEYSSVTPTGYKQMKTAMYSRFQSYPDQVKKLVNTMVENIKTADDAIKVASAIEKIDDKLELKKSNHQDLAVGFFTTEKTAEEKFNTKLQRAVEGGLFDEYLNKTTIEHLKTADGMTKITPAEKQIINTILSRIN